MELILRQRLQDMGMFGWGYVYMLGAIEGKPQSWITEAAALYVYHQRTFI